MSVDLSMKPDIKSVRRELRHAIFSVAFHAEMCKSDVIPEQEYPLVELATNFAAFGLNSGLFSDEEYKDWVLAAKDRLVLGAISRKYDSEEGE